MRIHDVEQGTPEWLAARAGVPTASEMDKIITPAKLEISKSLPSYVALKLAEKWMGKPIQTFGGTGMMDQGQIRQEDARPWYAATYDVELSTPGFITNDQGTGGCSPDALVVNRRRGVEIKCCEANKHVEYLLAGELPREHMIQVQASLLVTEYDEWDFVSYHAEFPAFVLTVRRDARVCNALIAGLAEFWRQFNDGWNRLVDANGGPPQRKYDTTYGPDGEEICTLKREATIDDLMNSPAVNG